MGLVVGYDRDFARQYFLRTFHGLAGGVTWELCPLPEEFEYLAERLSETTIFNMTDRLGSPWFDGNPYALARRTMRTTDRLLLQQAEAAANRLLLSEGLVRRGLSNVHGCTRRKRDDWTSRRDLAARLYSHASRKEDLADDKRIVLRRMPVQIQSWANLLALVPGNDYLEMLVAKPSSMIETV
jgi:hypothetical protein